jgi:hypothetical protein
MLEIIITKLVIGAAAAFIWVILIIFLGYLYSFIKYNFTHNFVTKPPTIQDIFFDGFRIFYYFIIALVTILIIGEAAISFISIF